MAPHRSLPILLGPMSVTPDMGEFEIVERKGAGHPDTICDAIAESLAVALSRAYLERFGTILHHNVDKALLCAGSSRPAFGGGQVLEPIEIHLGGRATRRYEGVEIPVEDLAASASRRLLAATLPDLDFERHVQLRCHIRPGSADLVALFARQQERGGVLANDTSFGTGFAPWTELEQTVLAVDEELHAAAAREHAPEVGADTKVMGVRLGSRICLTIACAFVDRHVRSVDDYLDKKRRLAERVREAAGRIVAAPLEISVNAGDDPGRSDLYLTVTGTSAEAGDDGQVGRGNRTSGLITPFRPMSLEAAAGKNAVTHAGKLYNVAAQRLAQALVEEIDEVLAAHCSLVSRIGHPLIEPALVGLSVRARDGRAEGSLRDPVERIVHAHLEHLASLRDGFLAGSLPVY